MDKQEFAKIVQAWADGEEIEVRRLNRVSDYRHEWGEWIPLGERFLWGMEYRVKPGPEFHYITRSVHGGSEGKTEIIIEGRATPPNFGDYVEIAFDPNTGKCLSAKIVDASAGWKEEKLKE